MMAQDLLRSIFSDPPREQRQPHEQASPTMPRSAERAKEACWSETARYAWADWTDCTESDDKERIQTASHEAGGSKKRVAQELDDQELVATIENILCQSLMAKAESRPWEAQMDSAMAMLEKSKLQVECAQQAANRAQEAFHATDTHRAEAELQVQKLRETVAQDLGATQEAPNDLTALIQLVKRLAAQVNTNQMPQTAGPILARLQQGLRASAAIRLNTASRSSSISSLSTAQSDQTTQDKIRRSSREREDRRRRGAGYREPAAISQPTNAARWQANRRGQETLNWVLAQSLTSSTATLLRHSTKSPKPHTETPADKASRIIGALTSGNLTKAIAQLTSFVVAPMTENTVQTNKEMLRPKGDPQPQGFDHLASERGWQNAHAERNHATRKTNVPGQGEGCRWQGG